MSSKAAHYACSTAVGGIVASGLYVFSGSNWLICVILFWGFICGSSAPDWLEISWRTGANREKRHSIIPHRTITHWMALWALIFGVCLQHAMAHQNVLSIFFLGFSASALIHVLMDSATPKGVPWLHPYKRIGIESTANDNS
jgi:inner membrane protein